MNTIDRPTAAAIAEAIKQANIKPSTGQQRIDEYDLLERIAEGQGWEDWRAEHRTNKLPRRIRRWLSEDTFTAEKRDQLVCAAKREFDLLTVLRHPNILLPIDLKIHELGPALVFDDDSDQPPLDDWLTEHGPALTLDDRIKIQHWARASSTSSGAAPRTNWLRDIRSAPDTMLVPGQFGTSRAAAVKRSLG